MSRVGKKPIQIPKGVTVDLKEDVLNVKGPKGDLQRKIDPRVSLQMDDDQILISVNE